RRSLDEVASFYFASRYDSYTARRGTAENAGVIGVALFEEKQARSSSQPLTRKSYEARPEPFPAARTSQARSEVDDGAAAPSEEHLGTGYGASEYSPVHETDFKRRRKARPDLLLTAYYDSHEGLQARGLLPRRVDVVNPYEPVYEPRDMADPRFAPSPWQRDR
ncbi:MAG: hypothetical protein KUG77_16970, partial [Nannocystaceae bacterium]|nr:hypothetical protein [Nannocystaceae bacterium]